MATFFYFCKVNEITLIGSGNVAWHLCSAFSGMDYTIRLFARNTGAAKEFQHVFGIQLIESLENIQNQLVIVCVSDSGIIPVLTRLDKSNRVACTSGTTDLKTFPSFENMGIFYPLQTFSKERKLNLFEVPFFIEANNTYFAQELFDLAWKLSHRVQFADFTQRKELHLAAVISNNFTNFLFGLAKEYLEVHQLDWKLLEPLIRETVSKAIDLGPEQAQTGPAKRNDRNTLAEHLSMLNAPEKELYTLLSNAILEHYNHEKL